jgi:hypothetical protein
VSTLPSREGRGAYGSGRKISDEVFKNYNPLGYRVEPFPTEQVCAFCESKCDVIFPMSPKLCATCALRVNGRQDILKGFKRKMDLNGYHCEWCDKVTYFPIIVNTRVCHKCTQHLANMTRPRQNAKYARRII